MKKKLFPFFSLVLAVGLAAGFAAEAQEEPLKRFAGHWQGQGKFSGMTAAVQSKWEWVLAGKFLRLAVSYEMTAPDGKKQIFEGHAYYQAKGSGHYEGRWFDSQGNAYPIKGTLEGNTLTSLWGEPGKSDGRSTYQINDADKTLEIVDATRQKDGSWKEFSRFTLTLSR